MAPRILLFQLVVIVSGLLPVVKLNLLINQLFELWDLQAEELEIEVEFLDRLSGGLVVLQVQPLQVRVLKSLLDGDPLRSVECQHLLDEVNRL